LRGGGADPRKKGNRHWASFHLLPWFGAIPVDERVVVEGDWIFAAGVTAGIDDALRLVAECAASRRPAQRIQFDIAYAPEPPFQSGTPGTAPAEIVKKARRRSADLIARREATARRVAATLGVPEPMKGLKSPGRVAATRASSAA
jgi:cyclohexyl-isocyanide hydratase